jgi:DNA replication licensing factor MCM7
MSSGTHTLFGTHTLSLSPSETFTKFVQEHTITVHSQPSHNDDDSDDDDAMLLPTADETLSARRVPAYPPHLQRIRQRAYYDDKDSRAKTFIVEVPLQELVAWDELKGGALAENATNNTIRYTKLFAQVLDEILLHLTTTADGTTANQSADVRESSWDLLNRQRVAQQEAAASAQEQRADGADPAQNPFVGGGNLQDEEGGPTNNNSNNPSNATMEIPPIVLRKYELRILPLGRPGRLPPFDKQLHSKDGPPAPKAFSLRQIRAPSLGHLVTVKGMVVRASDVKPCTVVATYACDRCGAEIYQPLDGQREFLPVRACPSPTCQAGGRQESLQLQTRTSKFIKFQEVKLQELPNQVPMGHVPRSLTLYCRGEWTRQVTAGDVVTMDGIFLPQKVGQGFRAMKAGLIATTYLEVQNMVLHKKSYDDADESLTPADRLALDVDIHEVTQSTDPIGRLARSIAPEIFGHEDIKRALLLQLVGGCARRLPDGMKIRGDINLCLMGDPGVAKSQLLKHVASIAPRGVYTTGKGSSGVGLTAAVTKDTSTGEMSLEGGALVLADRGICCIDEL